jgi:hypothetical protein
VPHHRHSQVTSLQHLALSNIFTEHLLAAKIVVEGLQLLALRSLRQAHRLINPFRQARAESII